MKESAIEKEVCEYASDRGWIPLKLTCPNKAGVPDRIFIGYYGKVLWVEFKTSTGRLSPNQERFIDKLKDFNQDVFVIDNVLDGKRLIDECS